MSKSGDKAENIIVRWVLILFIITVGVSVLVSKRYDFVVGLTIGTALGILRLKINAYTYSKIFAAVKSPNTVLMILFSLFSLLMLFLCLYLIISSLVHVNVLTVTGLFAGFGYIPLAITLHGILDSLYLIKKQ